MADELEHDERLILGDLLNHVLDKGVVVTGDVTISVADIDLVRLGLSLVLSSVETLEQIGANKRNELHPPVESSGDLPVLPRRGRE